MHSSFVPPNIKPSSTSGSSCPPFPSSTWCNFYLSLPSLEELYNVGNPRSRGRVRRRSRGSAASSTILSMATAEESKNQELYYHQESLLQCALVTSKTGIPISNPKNLSLGYLSISTHHTVPFCLVYLCRFLRVSSSAKLKDTDHRSNRSTLPLRFADLPSRRCGLLKQLSCVQ